MPGALQSGLAGCYGATDEHLAELTGPLAASSVLAGPSTMSSAKAWSFTGWICWTDHAEADA